MQRLNTYGAPMEQDRQSAPMDWSGEVSRSPVQNRRPQLNSREPGTDMAVPNPPELMDMRSNLPAEVIQAPTSREEAFLGSWKSLLSRYEGSYVVATFLVGTQGTVSWEGILFDVGNDYLTIYQESRDRYIVSDYYALKFIEFYDIQRRQRCAELLREDGWQSDGVDGGMGGMRGTVAEDQPRR